MKNLVVLMLCVAIVSCSTNEKAEGTAQAGQLKPETDTLMFGKEVLHFFPAKGIKTKRPLKDTLLKEGQVYRDSTGYTLTLRSGASIRLANDYDDDPDHYKMYEGFEDLDFINSWLFEVGHYEWSSYELVNKTTGEATEIQGYPVVSPHKDKIIIANEDIDAGFNFNGIEFYNLKDHRLVNVWSRDLNDIGLSSPVWQDNDTVVFRRENIGTRKVDFVKACIQ